MHQSTMLGLDFAETATILVADDTPEIQEEFRAIAERFADSDADQGKASSALAGIGVYEIVRT